MAEAKEKSIVLAQRWGAGKIEIGTKFKLLDTDRVMELVEDPEYPFGKFVFEDGEVYDIGKYFSSYFSEIKLEVADELSPTRVFDEAFWDVIDNAINVDNKGTIIQTFAPEQKNESFHDFLYYDVTELLKALIEDPSLFEKSNQYKKLYDYLENSNLPIFTKDKLAIILSNCEFDIKNDGISKVYRDGEFIGYLANSSDRYLFVPVDYKKDKEYSFENDKATGFYCTADSYLDVALTTMHHYNDTFIKAYQSASDKSSISLGYQADATVKTVLAFSCECYLKSLLIDSGKDLEELKKLGHGLSVLFTSLDDDSLSYVFDFMNRHGYNLNIGGTNPNFETNDLTEQFMLDLARVDEAFIDSRYCAENDKNTNYKFLYEFAIALRYCVKKKLEMNTPFSQSIENNLSL